MASVTYQATTTDSFTLETNPSHAHNSGTGDNRVLFAWMDASLAPTSVTYDGTSMTYHGTYGGARLYYLTNPSSGSNTFQINASNISGVVSVHSYYNAQQNSGVLEDEDYTSSGSSPISVTSTPVTDGAYVICFFTGHSSYNYAATSPATEIVNHLNNGSYNISVSHDGPIDPATGTTMEWTKTAPTTTSYIWAFAIKPATTTYTKANSVKANIITHTVSTDQWSMSFGGATTESKANSVKANIEKTTTKNNSVKGNIEKTGSVPSSVKASILKIGKTQNNSVKANIEVTETDANSAKAMIEVTETKASSVKANITHTVYSRGYYNSLPTTPDDLSTLYSTSDMTTVSTSNNTRVDQAGGNYLIHQFRQKHTVNTDNIGFLWEGQSDVAPTTSTVYLQVYNTNTDSWEASDSNNTTAVNTDFTLENTIESNQSNYYDTEYWVTWRVYQVV